MEWLQLIAIKTANQMYAYSVKGNNKEILIVHPHILADNKITENHLIK